MPNTFLEKIEYKIEETAMGTWMRYGYENGTSFHEFKSHIGWMGLPLIHYTYGRNPATGRRVVAKGVIAIGRIACGIIAIGQAAIGVYFGLGQLAIGQIAIGQFAYGKYVLAQIGFGENVLSLARKDELAVEFFKSFPVIKDYLH